jgi:hypothetical protein
MRHAVCCQMIKKLLNRTSRIILMHGSRSLGGVVHVGCVLSTSAIGEEASSKCWYRVD